MKYRSPLVAAALALAVLHTTDAFAQDWIYVPQGAISTELTGGYGAVANPAGGAVYGDGFGSNSYAVILDTGSSGFLMSNTVQDTYSVPLQSGQTYQEAGIGGAETMNVTQPLVAYYTPPSNTNPDNIASMTAYGTFTFEARQDDPFPGLIFFDIIGTPIIQQKVMVVTPAQTYNLVQATLGFLTAQTTLQNTVPVLPTTGTFHVPITWTNFITGSTVPTEGPNPVVNGVTAKGPNGVSVAHNWLLDSGSQFTIISPTYASELGVNLGNPINEIEGLGVGGSTVVFDEYQLTEIVLPLSNGDHLVFHNPFVWVPSDADLPADLTGILGENLFMQSADSVDPETGLPVGSHASLFSQWYLDGPGSELVLYDPNSTYGAIPPVWTGITSNTWSILTSDKNWAGGTSWTNNPNRSTPNNAIFNLAAPASITVNGLIDVGNITFTTGGWTLTAGAGLLTFGGTGTMNIVAATGTDTINAVIADGAAFGSGGGVTSVNIPGPGKLILGGPNTYSGGTTLNGGILLANNISGSATGSGNVILNAGILGGTGTIAGNVLPGTGPYKIHPSEGLSATSTATLTLGALTTNANTTLAFNLVSPGAASVNDLLHISSTGGLTLGGGIIQIANTSTGAASLGYYKAIQYHGAIQGAGISSLTLPATVNNISYTLDTTHDAGFIDIHRGFLGDANDNGIVNFDDFLILSQNFGQPGGWNKANFLGDPTVDFNDFLVLSQHFGQSILSTSSTATSEELAAFQNASTEFFAANGVPEPASVTLLTLGTIALLARKRRAFRSLDQATTAPRPKAEFVW